jgi:hypothetical protein
VLAVFSAFASFAFMYQHLFYLSFFFFFSQAVYFGAVVAKRDNPKVCDLTGTAGINARDIWGWQSMNLALRRENDQRQMNELHSLNHLAQQTRFWRLFSSLRSL